MTGSYSNIKLPVPTARTSAKQVSNIFLNYNFISFDIPSNVLTDNGLQFVTKFFVTVCEYLRFKYPTTTAYYPQTNGQLER